MKAFAKIHLKPNEEAEIRAGFPWVYDNETGSPESYKKHHGEAVEVFSASGLFLGTGILNSNSKILVRLLSRARAEALFDGPELLRTERAARYIYNLIENAYKLRFLYFNKSDSYRLFFGEADLIPGLIVERYCTVQKKICLVVQFLSLCCEIFRQEILSALQKVCSPDVIYERSDVHTRILEGLEHKTGYISGALPEETIVIRENSVLFKVDIAAGQKTGFFLDQKFNRAAAAALAKGRTVLDLFAHTGAFGLNAARGGAKHIIACDSSPDAVRLANENILLNKAAGGGLKTGGKMEVLQDDAFELLRNYEKSGTKFDMVIIDPPAFAKSAQGAEKAFGAYKELNLRAMKILNEGGVLISASCSHFFWSDVFYSMLQNAARDAFAGTDKRLRILEKRGAAPDHPILIGYPKSEYLKCAICSVRGGG